MAVILLGAAEGEFALGGTEGLEQINRKIAAVADQIARQRELIDRCRKEGKSTERAEAALEALTRLFRALLTEREAREKEQS